MSRSWGAAGIALFWLALPVAASADYLVFRDGRAMKVSAYRFEGQATVVELAGGGSMRFGVEVVSHVAPDEDLEAAPAPAAAVVAAALLEAPGEDGWLSFADPRFVEPIQRIASSHDLDPALVAAVIKVESNFHPHAVSPKGAQGLMQLMPGTAREHGVGDPFDPEANIAGGVGYLSRLVSRYQGDLKLALAAYNAGPKAVDRARGIPAFAETRKYVARVLGFVEQATAN